MRLLFIGPSFTQHAVRHLNLVAATGHEVHFASITPDAIAPGFSAAVHFHFAPPLRLDEDAAFPVTDEIKSLFHSFGMSVTNLGDWLATLIDDLTPDAMIALSIQYGGYPLILARPLLANPAPPLIVSNWGADIHFWGDQPLHHEAIRVVVTPARWLFTVCAADVERTRRYGFTGDLLTVQTPGGGWDLDVARALRARGPLSRRRTLLIKGNHGLVGRGEIAVEAARLAADALAGSRIVIITAQAGVPAAARRLAAETGIAVEIMPNTPYLEVLAALGHARAYVGLSLSDAVATTALEALVMGAFPIQSSPGCVDEWIEDGLSGLIVPPEDPEAVAAAIRRAMTDDALIENAGEINARTVQTRLTSERVDAELLNGYVRVSRELGLPD
ncbi:MAG: glycosyltransferase [Thermomicrobiales bacterium]